MILEELTVSLQDVVLVLDPEDEEYYDNYIRWIRGPVWLARGEPEEKTEIGRVELIYYNGSRAIDHSIDIVDVADSLGQPEFEYARVMYTKGSLDDELLSVAMSNDLLAIRSVSILPKYQGRDYGIRVVRKLAETIGYHCGAVVMDADVLSEAGIEAGGAPDNPNALELHPTENPTIYRIE